MRIVAGEARGRRLAAPPAGTRPTSDRVREALFNTLATTMELDGARVLDLFAGTGAVGLEALSRGAGEAVLVEKGRAALAVLRRNVDTVGLPGARVAGSAVEAFVREPPDVPFDLLFADPPYAYGPRIGAVLAALGRGGWLAPQARVVVETSARADPPQWPDASVTPVAHKRYGDTVLWYGSAR